MESYLCLRHAEHVLGTFTPCEDQAKRVIAVVQKVASSHSLLIGGSKTHSKHSIACPLHPLPITEGRANLPDAP